MKILVSAEAFGYGPIITCLNVTKYLKKYDNVKMTFIGTGIALEQARMTDHFDRFVECKTFDFDELKQVEDVFLEHDLVLSSENINGARFALKLGIENVYYMDNLMWMWDKLEEGLEDLKGYIISEIIPSKRNFLRIGQKIKNPIFVGPLRNIEVNKNVNIKNKLLINIGGAEAFIIDSKIVKRFYNKLINDVLSSELLISKFDKIIICGGSGAIDNLVVKNPSSKIVVKTLSNDYYLKEMDNCSHCIMASGLGNFIETVGRDKNIMYLPPVNYSQLLQLDYYDKMNLGFELINWDKFDFFKEVPRLLNEEEGVNLVLENVQKYILQNEDTIKKTVDKYLLSSQEGYYEKRNEYANSFDRASSRKVADIIYNGRRK